jgi:DNA topoisomerase II
MTSRATKSRSGTAAA